MSTVETDNISILVYCGCHDLITSLGTVRIQVKARQDFYPKPRLWMEIEEIRQQTDKSKSWKKRQRKKQRKQEKKNANH